MCEQFVIDGPLRSKAYERLQVFLKNPGRFCLIITGSRGVGKRFMIERAFEKFVGLDESYCLIQPNFIDASLVPSNQDEIDDWLAKSENSTIIIEDVEKLSHNQQDMLISALSTEDGKFGINRKTRVRMAFTSSTNCEELRTDGVFLKGGFWDRISQLIVEVPSFKDESSFIVKDFHATWKKMKFDKLGEFQHFSKEPKNPRLEKFLDDHASKFEGGFRDLDKIACMYFNYRILYYQDSKRIDEEIEKKIVEQVQLDFFGKTQLHQDQDNELSLFQIQKGFSMAELNAQFKIQIRKWALKEYGTLTKAEENLKLGKGTIKNYVAGKVDHRKNTSTR